MVKDYPIGDQRIFPRSIFGQGEYKLIINKDFTLPSIKAYIASKFPDGKIARVGLHVHQNPTIDILELEKGLDDLQNDSIARTYIQVERRGKTHTTLIYGKESPYRGSVNGQDKITGEFMLIEVDGIESREHNDERNADDGWDNGQIPMEFAHRGDFFGLDLRYCAEKYWLENIDRAHVNYELQISGHNPGPVSSSVIDFLNAGITESEISDLGPVQKKVRKIIV